MIAEELVQFGVSLYDVGTVWRKHRLDILDTANQNAINLKRKLGAVPPQNVPVEEFHRRVKLAPFQYRKCICILSNYTGIPKSTLHRALKGGLLTVTKSSIKPLLTENYFMTSMVQSSGETRMMTTTMMTRSANRTLRWT